METNTSKYLRRPLTQIRRKDRALDDTWIDRMLSTAAVGHIALVLDGQPLLTSNLFWFDGARLYWHAAPVGKFRAVVESGADRACFSVSEHGRILPAATSFDFSTEYASVVAYGTVRVVSDPDEKRRALDGLMAKYAPHLEPGVDYEPMPDRDVDLTSVFCMEIDSRVGKHNVKPADYPAYAYPGGSFIDAEREAGRTTMLAKELA